MKINWFSPLLPAKTDIAHYTFRILPELSKCTEIVLWTDRANWDKKLEQYASVKYYQLNNLLWSEINNADLNVYHLGNNAKFHTAIWKVSRKCPGVVVLHDYRLHHFFGEIYREQSKNKDSYLQQMIRHYGQDCRQIAEDFWDGKLSTEFMAKHYPLTNLAVEGAIGVITHNRKIYQNLTQKNRSLIGYIPLPYGDKSPIKSKHLTNRPPYKLIVFGYINLNRRLESILEALATLPEKKQFQLDIYGELWDSHYIQQKINYFKLNKLTKIHGFVEENILDSALANSHLAMNLRYPTMGEASGSQLRIWSHALPSIVTKIGWYATLPKDTVVFVNPDREIENIQQHLRNFILKPEEFAEIGRRGKQLLKEKHAPETYAQDIFNFAEKAIKFRTHPLAEYLIKKVSNEMSLWRTYNLSKEQIENTAGAINFLIN